MGIAGALRCQELLNLSLDDIEDKGASLFITIRDTKTKTSRAFYIIDDKDTVFNFFPLYKKYISLRPSHTPHRRFFVYYKNGKCSTQVIGKNTLGKIPATIAKYLNLSNPELYTGHCIRRSSATMLANTGADMTTIKRFGGWKSTTVAEGYIETSTENRMNIAKQMLIGQKDGASTSVKTSSNFGEQSVSITDVTNTLPPGKNPYINIVNSSNINITIN